jgi:hypothetical protein
MLRETLIGLVAAIMRTVAARPRGGLDEPAGTDGVLPPR